MSTADLLKLLCQIPLHDLRTRREVESYIMEKEPSFPIWLRRIAMTNLSRQAKKLQWHVNLKAIHAASNQLLGFDAPEWACYHGPTLVVRGGLSSYVLREHRPSMYRYFPQHTLETIEGVGHFPHIQSGEALESIVTKFLLDMHP